MSFAFWMLKPFALVKALETKSTFFHLFLSHVLQGEREQTQSNKLAW